jgi:hypothetical protein
MATTTTNFGWDIPQSTDLVKDGATAIAALGQDIDTAMVDLKGGTTGQVLSKASGADLDFSWVAQDDSNAIQNAIVDAKGDLIAATASDTPARLAVGTNGQVLTADSAEATGLKWAASPAGALSLVKTQTIGTGVSSIAVTNAFSSTYDSYLIIVSGGVLSGNFNLQLQLGSTTTGYYTWGYYVNPSSTTLNADPGNNVSNFLYSFSGSTSGCNGIVTLIGPNLAKPTAMASQGMRPSSARTYVTYTGTEDSSTQHTGFTLIVDGGGTATGGTIKVYGYVNS